MDEREIVLNLWYVADDTGAIYSLRALAYVADGSDQAKLEFLHSRSHLDYLVASPFPVPDRYHVTFVAPKADGSSTERRMPVTLGRAIEILGGPIVLFEDVFSQLERQFPSQTSLTIGPRPLYCLTPLYADDELNIHPVVTDAGRKPANDAI